MHEIRYFRFPYKKSKKMILKECQIVANENGDYPNQITGIDYKNFDFFKNEIEVNKWLEKNDRSYYNVALPFKGTHGKQLWLVKIEYHV